MGKCAQNLGLFFAIGLSIGLALTGCKTDQLTQSPGAVQTASAAASGPSVNLPTGFSAMPDNSPPGHEGYIKELAGNHHSLTFSADRRRLKELSEVFKKEEFHMIGPMVSGTLAVAIEGQKHKIRSERAGIEPRTNFFSIDPNRALPEGSCDGFRWTAEFIPKESRSSIFAQGITVACVFWDKKGARMTGATVSEQSRDRNDLSRGYLIETAYPILKSLKY